MKTRSNWLGILIGVALGLVGLFLVRFLSVFPCSSTAAIFDDARQSPMYNHSLGFECDRWPTPVEAVFLEWLPVLAVLALAGATGARLGSSTSALRGAVTAAIVGGLGFALRTIIISYGFFDNVRPISAAAFGVVSVVVGLIAGGAGGFLAKKLA